MNIKIEDIIDIIRNADGKTACNWFSYVYSLNLLVLTGFIIIYFIITYKRKHTSYFHIILAIIFGFSILITLVFAFACHEPLPKSSVLTTI
jgi:hypothetical protein